MRKFTLLVCFAVCCLKIVDSGDLEEWNTRVQQLNQWPCQLREYMIKTNKSDNNPATGVIPDVLLIKFCGGYCPRGYVARSINPSGESHGISKSKTGTYIDQMNSKDVKVTKERGSTKYVDLGDPEIVDLNDHTSPEYEDPNGQGSSPIILDLTREQTNQLRRNGRSLEAPPTFFPETCHPTATTDTFYVSAYKDFLTSEINWKWRYVVSHYHCMCQYWD